MNSFLVHKLLIEVSVFAFAFFPTVKSNAQFLNKDATWTVRSVTFGDAPIKNYEDTHILKDSVINGINYSLFEFRNTLSALREVNDKVFFKVLKHNQTEDVFDTLEHVLYDFNLIEGDSIQLELPSYSQFYKKNWVVREVDSILIGNELKKRMFLEIPDSYGPGNTQYWIEDIGSTFGPLYFTGISEHEWEIGLICYRLNETNLYGKCLIVDAGKDTTYCSDQNFKSLILGTTSKITNGKPPYKFAWECDYRLSDKLIFSASDFLSDTSLQSPVFKDIPVDQDWLKFTLTVTDAENNYSKDSLFVRFSSFAYLTGGGQPRFYIEKGDSILLTFPNAGIGGGIEPLTYYWRPKTYLSDPDSLVTWCKPDSSIQYEAFAIDSCGCVSFIETVYDIRVLPKKSTLLEPDKTWVFLLAGDYPNPEIYDDLCYKIGNDTIIGETEYKQLLFSQGCDTYNGIRGFIRETEEGKVYFMENRPQKEDEFLLYDFGMQAGDSAKMGWENIYYRIDSIRLSSNEKKLFYVSKSSDTKDTWIEGVGSEMGLLREQITGGSMMFSCCLVNNEQLYHNPDFADCYFKVNSVKKRMTSSEISFFPNPAKNQLTISNPSNIPIKAIEMTDFTGRIIQTWKAQEMVENTLNIQHIPPGIYLLKATTETGIKTGKLVIQ